MRHCHVPGSTALDNVGEPHTQGFLVYRSCANMPQPLWWVEPDVEGGSRSCMELVPMEPQAQLGE